MSRFQIYHKLIEANVFQHVFPELNTEFAVRHVATSDTLQHISSNLDHDFHFRRHTNGSIAPSMKFTSGERKRSDFHCNHQRNLSTEVEVARETMQQKSTIDSRTFLWTGIPPKISKPPRNVHYNDILMRSSWNLENI